MSFLLNRNLVLTQDEDEVLDYTVDWTDQLNGATIATLNWSDPTPVTVPPLVLGTGLRAYTNTTTHGTLWLSGGAAGTDYTVEAALTPSSSPAPTIHGHLLIKVRTNF